MQPIFPMRNWAINSLIEFRQGAIIYDFCKYFETNEKSWKSDHLEFTINHLIELFGNLKEEITQTIHTSNKITIITYFEELKQIISNWKLDIVDPQDIFNEVKVWNDKKYKEFLEKVSKKSEEYFAKPERTKYAHLEEYEHSFYGFLTQRTERSKEINKNFYCIEDEPEYIDINYIEKYLIILSDITEKFNQSVSQELRFYNEGKLISDINSEKSFYDRIVDKIKNNKIIAGILIGFLIYGGISEAIKYTKENVDNLYGKDGLLNESNKNQDSINIQSEMPINLSNDSLIKIRKDNSNPVQTKSNLENAKIDN